MLRAESTLYQHPNAKTMYVTIPAKIASDSQFPFKAGDYVRVKYIPKAKKIEVTKVDKS